MSRLPALALTFVICVAVGCGAHRLGSDSGTIDSSSFGGPEGSCPAAIATLDACDSQAVDLTCQGTTTCDCGGKFVQLETSCSCEEDSFGTSFRCNDDCTDACVHPTFEGPPPSTQSICVAYAQFVYSCIGQPEGIDEAAELCASAAQSCGASLDAFMSCIDVNGVSCNRGKPVLLGCDAEAAAIATCAPHM